ncbi:MAG: 6-phosphogluconolactonase [Pirellulales bacterium]
MHVEVFADPDEVARQAARFVATQARESVTARGRFVMAVSGGQTPWQMLRALAAEQMPWQAVHIVQVDERVAPAGDAARNLTHIKECLLPAGHVRPEQILAMPVERADLEAAADGYARTLATVAATPPILDLAHLGLGPDGHTASLVPGDPALTIRDRDVAISGVYQGHRRMTLTYPMLDRARCILWLVTGTSKTTVLPKLLAADAAIPAGRVVQTRATLFADRAAVGEE